jgi:hypothetical protein
MPDNPRHVAPVIAALARDRLRLRARSRGFVRRRAAVLRKDAPVARARRILADAADPNVPQFDV